MVMAGLVLVVLGIAGCRASTSPVPAPPAGGGSVGSVSETGSGAAGGSDSGSSGGGGDVTTAQAAPHENGVVHSPIDFDPTIPPTAGRAET